jgi:protein-arginine kinase activator protein McsA
MECQSCGKQKAELVAKESKLWLRTKILLCPTCIKAKMEPRAFVILAGRMNGAESVSDYIINKRYCGAEITAKELVARPQ